MMKRFFCLLILSTCLLVASTFVEAAVAVSPGALDFGTVFVGSKDIVKSFSFINSGNQTATVTNCTIDSPFVSTTSNLTIPANEQRSIGVIVRGTTAPGSYTGLYKCTVDGANAAVQLTTKVIELLSINPLSVNFGNVPVRGNKSIAISIKNNASGPITNLVAMTLKIEAVVSRALPNPFVASPNFISLKPAEQKSVSITMNAGDLPGSQTGKLIVEFSGAGESKRTITIPLQGTVTAN